MAIEKHTIKECKRLLRSCLSMLDALCPYSYTIEFADWRIRCYSTLAHIYAISPESQLTEPWLFNRIVTLYNEINCEYLKL